MLQKTHRKTAINNVRDLDVVFLIKEKHNLRKKIIVTISLRISDFLEENKNTMKIRIFRIKIFPKKYGNSLISFYHHFFILYKWIVSMPIFFSFLFVYVKQALILIKCRLNASRHVRKFRSKRRKVSQVDTFLTRFTKTYN